MNPSSLLLQEAVTTLTIRVVTTPTMMIPTIEMTTITVSDRSSNHDGNGKILSGKEGGLKMSAAVLKKKDTTGHTAAPLQVLHHHRWKDVLLDFVPVNRNAPSVKENVAVKTSGYRVDWGV